MISEFDIEELVRGMGNLDDDYDVTLYVYEKFNVEWDSFCLIIKELMPLIEVFQSPLTGNIYKGFGKEGLFFIKQLTDNEQGER